MWAPEKSALALCMPQSKSKTGTTCPYIAGSGTETERAESSATDSGSIHFCRPAAFLFATTSVMHARYSWEMSSQSVARNPAGCSLIPNRCPLTLPFRTYKPNKLRKSHCRLYRDGFLHFCKKYRLRETCFLPALFFFSDPNAKKLPRLSVKRTFLALGKKRGR